MKNMNLIGIIIQRTGEVEPLSIDVLVEDFTEAQHAINALTDELVAGQTLTVWSKQLSGSELYDLMLEDLFSMMMRTTLDDIWEQDGWFMQLQAVKR
ncbi:MAG: hypothetical protein H9W81_08835 [Enterococcus sp.]|nr:hypothetical protein [Enterococcus sp.]